LFAELYLVVILVISGDPIVKRELAIAMLGIHESLLLLQSTEEVL
jgi:hypothetical protein